jgi:hypothetical protein
VYAELALPSPIDRVVRITNTATPPANPIEFELTVPSLSNGTFSLPSGTHGVLEPGESMDFTIEFTWFAGVLSTAPLVLRSADPTEPAVEIPMFAEAAYGELVFDDPPDPDQILVLPAVAVGQTSTFTIRAHNGGDFELGIEDAGAFLSTTGSAELLGDTFHARVPPGGAIEWTLTCTPADGDGTGGTLGFDFFTSARENQSVSFSCPVASAQLAADPAALDFGAVAIGGAKTLAVHVTNTGTLAADLGALVVDGDGFALAGPIEATVAPGASQDVAVAFAPAATGAFTGQLRLGDAAAPTLAIALAGLGASADPGGGGGEGSSGGSGEGSSGGSGEGSGGGSGEGSSGGSGGAGGGDHGGCAATDASLASLAPLALMVLAPLRRRARRSPRNARAARAR